MGFRALQRLDCTVAAPVGAGRYAGPGRAHARAELSELCDGRRAGDRFGVLRALRQGWTPADGVLAHTSTNSRSLQRR